MCYRLIYSLTKLGDEPDTCLMAVPIRPRARIAHITHITYNWGPPRAEWGERDKEPTTMLCTHGT